MHNHAVMLLRYALPALLLAAAAPGQCLAQESEANAAGAITSIGTPHDTIQSMLMELGVSHRVRDNCWNLGCLVIVNDTQSYDVIGFYVNTAAPGANPRWSRNQFGLALRPSGATLRFKTGGPDACEEPVRFVLRHRETRKKVELEGTASMCTTPHMDSILHVKILDPQVILEDGRAE